MLLSKIYKIYKDEGLKFVLKKIMIICKIYTENRVKKMLKVKLSNYKNYQSLLEGKYGLEIGGPSSLFMDDNLLPIYSVISGLDGVNFSENTIWSGKISEGKNYKYSNGRIGHQYILDGIDLERIQSGSYDFVLSCNNLEHIANPLKAIEEWTRVLKPKGFLLLVLPRKEHNFDRFREITSFEHLKEDYKNNIKEDDLSHLDEILKHHDLLLDSSGNIQDFKERSLKNIENRCLHHHVFDIDLLKDIYGYFNIQELLSDCTKSEYIMIGQKQ